MNIFGIFGALDWNANKQFDENNQFTAVHDSGATLFSDGKLIANISEERLTRNKGEGNFPYKSIEYCLSMGDMNYEDIDIVYIPDLACNLFNQQKYNGTLEKIIKTLFPNSIYKSVSHHVCHAASSVFTSSYNEGTFFTLDGTGSSVFNSIIKQNVLLESHSIGYFNKEKNIFRFFPGVNGYNLFGGYHYSNSKEIYHEKVKEPPKLLKDDSTLSGKIMGLCAYGNYKNSKDWKEYAILEEYNLPIVYFGKKVENLNLSPEDKASIVQKNFESALLDYLRVLKERSYLDDTICFSGGCFLNVLSNTNIKKSNLFENIHIPPFTNDSGISFGAAAYAVFIHEKEYDFKIPEDISMMSKSYSDDEIENDLLRSNVKFKKYNNFNDICDYIAEELNENKIVAWFQDSSESGPRALGSRSLLMNPKLHENKDLMNLRIKHREYWRPFAGIIIEDSLNEYFVEDFVSPHMLYSYKVKSNKKHLMPAIIHEDDTCRVQTVNKNQNFKIYSLLESFNKKSHVPVLLNTSFNDNGEPIVESPNDAISSFLKMNIDILVIGNYICVK
jgi:carbamoyltransferase